MTSTKVPARISSPMRRLAWPGVGLILATLFIVAPAAAQSRWESMRLDMVDRQIRGRGIRHPDLLDAMETIPRHLFVPERAREDAYLDQPVPVSKENGAGIPQPYVSARMIELLGLEGGDERVLEIGTGSGYDAALLSKLAREVYTIEIDEGLATEASSKLEDMGYENVFVKAGDGNEGWPEKAPFDAILLTAAPEDVPMQLLDQLVMHGRMVVAIGGYMQELTVIEKTPDGNYTRRVEPVRIGPMSSQPEP